MEVKAKPPGFEVNSKIMGLAAWVMLNKQPAGRFTSTIPEARSAYLPSMVLTASHSGPGGVSWYFLESSR